MSGNAGLPVANVAHAHCGVRPRDGRRQYRPHPTRLQPACPAGECPRRRPWLGEGASKRPVSGSTCPGTRSLEAAPLDQMPVPSSTARGRPPRTRRKCLRRRAAGPSLPLAVTRPYRWVGRFARTAPRRNAGHDLAW